MVSRPTITMSIIPAEQEAGLAATKVLIIGQMLTGTATAGSLVENIGNAKDEDALFGKQSMIAGMIRKFKEVNKLTRVDAIALADNSTGTAATATATITGTATAAGSVKISIGSKKDFTFETGVASGKTASDIASSLVSVISANDKLPFTAAAVSGVITFTAKHKGLEYNDSLIECSSDAAGISVAITAFAGGATNPILTGVFDVVNTIRYQTVVIPSSYDYATVCDWLNPRFNKDNSVLDGVAFAAKADTLANLKLAVASLNSQSFSLFGYKLANKSMFKGPSIREFGYNVAAHFASVRALRFTDGADISQFIVTTSGALDNFGGSALASLPYHNTPMPALSIIDSDLDWSEEDVTELENASISVIGNNSARNSVILGDVVTSYKTDKAGNEDLTWKFLNGVDTDVVIREYIVNNMRRDYVQSRLSNGEVIDGRSVATKASIEAQMDLYYDELSGSDYACVSNGKEDKKIWKNSRKATIDLANGTVMVTAKYVRVGQLRKILGSLQATFKINN